MDNISLVFALAGVVSTLAGIIYKELSDSRNAYRDEAKEYQAQLKLNTEAMRELAVFVRETVPLLAEFRVMLPTLRDMLEDDPPPKRTTRRTAP